MISFIIATIGRPSLADTVASIEVWPGDEILIVGDPPEAFRPLSGMGPHVRFIPCPRGGDWGSTERNVATPFARGRYLAHIDDDDVYTPGARALMADAIMRHPAVPTIFRMRLPDGSTPWLDPVIRWGNVGTPMFLTPNVPAKLGRWGEHQDCGDLRFLQTMHWRNHEVAWREDVIAHVLQGHP